MHQSVLHPFSEPLAGKIMRVKELVRVRNVTLEEGKVAMAQKRSEDPGWVVGQSLRRPLR